MTVSTETNHNEYTGNGVTTSFPYTFRIFTKSDLVVFITEGESVKELQLDADYAVSGAGSFRGGNIELKTALTAGVKISIERKISATQETDLRNQGKFFAEVHEDAFDKLTMLNQQGAADNQLALKKPARIANYYDADSTPIKHLPEPLLEHEPSTKGYADGLYTEFSGKADQLNDAFTKGMYGYIPIDSFQKGATLTLRNQALKDEVTGEFYRWDGDWSKSKWVPEGSTPENAGGVGSGKWVGIGDAALRGDMRSLTSPSLIGLSNYNDIRNYSGASDRLAAIHPLSTNIDCTYATYNLNAALMAEDDGAIVLVDKLGRRWVRQFTGNPDVRWWGAKEGDSDSAKSFNDAAKYSWATGSTIEVNGEYTCKSPILAGVVGNDIRYANVSFSGAGSAHDSTSKDRGAIYFEECDGFKVVRRNTLTLRKIYARGVKNPDIILDSVASLLTLKNSAVSAYYDTAEVNCIIDVSYCRFEGWQIGFDQSKAAWSSTIYNNEIYKCYQAGIFFKPNNSQIEKNKVAYCARGMLLIKPLSGRFSLNELNSSNATEYLIYLQEPAAYSIPDNYIEPWTSWINKNCNWGLGYIPIIIELNLYQPSLPVVSGCEIYTVNSDAEAAILYTVPEAYKDFNYLTYAQLPDGNTLKARKGILVASRGAGNLSFRQPGWSGTEKTAINGASGTIHFTAMGCSTHVSIIPEPGTISALMSSGEKLKIQDNVTLDRTGGSVDATSFVNTYRSRQQFAVSLQITAGSTAVNMFFDAFRNSNVQNRLPVTVPANEIRYLTFILTPPQDGSLVNYSFSLGVRGGAVAAPASMVIDITRTFV